MLPTRLPCHLTIGIFVALLPPEHLGGAELQAERLARELASRGHRVHIFARQQGTRPASEWRDGVQVHRRPVVSIPGLRLVGEMLQAAVQAARCKPDVLLCFMTLNSGLLGFCAHVACRKPFIIWQRALAEARLRPQSSRTRLRAFLYARAAGVWVQAESLSRTLKHEYEATGRARAWNRIAPRVRVLGNGIEMPVETPGAAAPERRYLFVGRLTPEKDLPTLVAAARRLDGDEIWIAGAGPLGDSLRQLAVGAPVRFLGEQPHARIPELLRDCRALVLCSTEEGMPNVVLEALAQGRPVVATAVGAVPELVQDGVNGLLVQVGDVEGLASALGTLRDDEIWRRLAAAARPSVLRFAWPQLVDRVERELGEVV